MISVVIVHWNTPDLLARCMSSIHDSKPLSPGEIIVVDCDSSPPGVEHVVRRFAGVRLIQLPHNDGYAAGCNAGAKEATGEVVLFLNADTEVEPDAIDRLNRCFTLNPRIGLVAPLLLNRDGTVQSSGYDFPGVMNLISDLLPVPDRVRGSRINGRINPGSGSLPYAVDYALGAALAVRSSALREIGGWDESYRMYSEEIDLAQRLAAADWSRLIEPRARIVHLGGASTGQQPTEMHAALWRSRGLYHRRWSNRHERHLLRWVVDLATRTGPMSDDRRRAVREAFASGLAG